jgi:DNA-binding NarL/FixJ family response regulator
MQMKVLTPVFAAVLVTISLAMLQMANADSFLSSSVQPREKQDAMNATITDGLRLANQSSQQWQEKQHNQSDQQEQPLLANGLNSHNGKLDNRSPSAVSILPF